MPYAIEVVAVGVDLAGVPDNVVEDQPQDRVEQRLLPALEVGAPPTLRNRDAESAESVLTLHIRRTRLELGRHAEAFAAADVSDRQIPD